VSYTEDETVRRYDKEGYVPVVPLSAIQEKIEKDEKAAKEAEGENSGISACPVAPVLWLFGLHKAKKPANHPTLSKEELLKEVNE